MDKKWCAREDLNLQPFRDQILSLARLPFRHARNLQLRRFSVNPAEEIWLSDMDSNHE
jgi:hypothetical protein